jgi:Mu transposase, C-terminal
VEALLTWVTRKFTHRLPGTTKANPADRGAYDSKAEAEKAGITLAVLEKLFIQSIVDAYLQEWDHLRRGRRISLWEDAVQEKGVPNYLGSPDDLKLLLMKAGSSKNPVTGRYAISPSRGLSFLGYRYVRPGLLDRLRGKEVDIYFDRRDISVIYLFEEGELRGEAYCTELLGQRMSIWEVQALRKSKPKKGKQSVWKTASAFNKKRLAGGVFIRLLTKRVEKPDQPGNSSRTGPNDVTCACERPVCTSSCTRAERRASAGHSRRWCASAFCCPGADTQMEEQ